MKLPLLVQIFYLEAGQRDRSQADLQLTRLNGAGKSDKSGLPAIGSNCLFHVPCRAVDTTFHAIYTNFRISSKFCMLALTPIQARFSARRVLNRISKN